jgi:hypothetical protein
MELTKENLREWKALLRRKMAEQYDIANYDETMSDEEWLKDWEGFTVQDVIDEEVSNWYD